MYFNQRVTIDELIGMLKNYNYKYFQIHHTWKPNYSTVYQKDAKGNLKYTPEQLNQNMKTYHVGKGWGDIAQHISTFPDGTILIGRNFGKTPVGITGKNTGAFALEQVGDFDLGQDIITVAQRNVLLKLIAHFVSVGTKPIFHREYASKTCPGTSLHKNGLIEASKYYFETGDLRAWITGADVAELQKKLGVTVDGSFGNDTVNALKNYQSSKGLPVTGNYDKATKEAMGTSTNVPNKPNKPTQSMTKAQKAYVDEIFSYILKTPMRIMPSVTLAQSILEGAWGTSDKAIRGNNVFGIKAKGDWKGKKGLYPTKEEVNGKLVSTESYFREYDSLELGVKDHDEFFVTPDWRANYYKKVLDAKTWRDQCNALTGTYATDTSYALKLIDIIERYHLYDYDKEAIMEKMPVWAEKDIKRMIDLGILKGDAKGKINPNNNVTRAEISVMMSRLLDYVENNYTKK